jgi:hypothetical protein
MPPDRSTDTTPSGASREPVVLAGLKHIPHRADML